MKQIQSQDNIPTLHEIRILDNTKKGTVPTFEQWLEKEHEEKKQGRQSLYDETVVIRVEQLASQGLYMKDIAKALGIAVQTLYEWCNKHQEIAYAIKKYRNLANISVENALLKNALGYQTKEVKRERRRIKGDEYGMVLTEEIDKEVQGNTAAQIFWLKNRMPEKWKDKIEQSITFNNVEAMAFALKRRSEDE